MGRVTSTIRDGELFLRHQGDAPRDYRLAWSPGDEERTRPLPAGSYVALGYRHRAEGADGRPWIWSTTSPGFREIVVEAGETAHVAVRDHPGVKTSVRQRDEGWHVGLAFEAEPRLGHTLYRDGARIPMRWACLDEAGEVLAGGAMRYG